MLSVACPLHGARMALHVAQGTSDGMNETHMNTGSHMSHQKHRKRSGFPLIHPYPVWVFFHQDS